MLPGAQTSVAEVEGDKWPGTAARSWSGRCGPAMPPVGASTSIVGALAIAAASRGGPAEGFLGSLDRLREHSWSKPVLLALAGGLLAYAVWRGLDAIVDLAGHGRGFGWVERFGLFFVAALHLLFAWYTLRLAIGGPWTPWQRRQACGPRRLSDRPDHRALVRRARRHRHDLARLVLHLEGRAQQVPVTSAPIASGSMGRAVVRLRFGRPRHGLLGHGRVHRLVRLELRAAGGRRFRRCVGAHSPRRLRAGAARGDRRGPGVFLALRFVESAFRVLPARGLSGR